VPNLLLRPDSRDAESAKAEAAALAKKLVKREAELTDLHTANRKAMDERDSARDALKVAKKQVEGKRSGRHGERETVGDGDDR
jgi:hypothetical protein